MCGLFLKRLHASKTVTLLNLFTKTCNKCLPLHVQVVVAWKRWENVYGNCLKIVDWLMEGCQGRSSEVNWYLAAAVLIHFVRRVLLRFQFLFHCTKNVQIQRFSWSVFSRIWTECKKIQTRKIPYLDTFHALSICDETFHLKVRIIFKSNCTEVFSPEVPEACNFIKKQTLAQLFPSEFWEIFKNTFFHKAPLVAASLFSASLLIIYVKLLSFLSFFVTS